MNTALKEARDKSGLRQWQVAEKVHISERQYIRIESGERDPRTQTSIHIAEVLGIKDFEQFKTLFGAATPDNTQPDGNQCRAGSSERPTR